MSANASALTFGNPAAPDGDQVAFIKDTGSMSQSVYLAVGVYNLSFMAAERYFHQTQAQTVDISVAGPGLSERIGTVTPDSPRSTNGWYPAGTTFGLYSTRSFTVTTPGWYNITFAGLSPTTANSTIFIDDVQLNV